MLIKGAGRKGEAQGLHWQQQAAVHTVTGDSKTSNKRPFVSPHRQPENSKGDKRQTKHKTSGDTRCEHAHLRWRHVLLNNQPERAAHQRVAAAPRGLRPQQPRLLQVRPGEQMLVPVGVQQLGAQSIRCPAWQPAVARAEQHHQPQDGV